MGGGLPEFNPGRLKSIFSGCLVDASRTGTIPRHLHHFLSTVQAHWPCDTQENEGANNEIKQEVRLAPNVSMALCGSRFSNRKEITIAMHSIAAMRGCKEQQAKRDAVHYLAHECVDHLDTDSLHEVAKSERWEPPKRIELDDRVTEELKVRADMTKKVDSKLAFAAHFNSLWNRGYKHAWFDVCFGFRMHSSGELLPTTWFCASKFRSLGHMNRCEVLPDGETVQICLPLLFRSSRDVFRDMFDVVHRGDILTKVECVKISILFTSLTSAKIKSLSPMFVMGEKALRVTKDVKAALEEMRMDEGALETSDDPNNNTDADDMTSAADAEARYDMELIMELDASLFYGGDEERDEDFAA